MVSGKNRILVIYIIFIMFVRDLYMLYISAELDTSVISLNPSSVNKTVLQVFLNSLCFSQFREN